MIIALNKSDNQTPEDQWDPANATAKLLNSAQAQIKKNATFRKYVDYWNDKDDHYHVATMQDLLKRYYATVDVIRLPLKSRYELLNQQRKRLQDLISTRCESSYESKAKRQMSLNADEFGLYLNLALTHFSESLELPFDFMKAWSMYRPTPETLSECITSLAVEIGGEQNIWALPQRLFKILTPFVASCLLLDAARQARIGMSPPSKISDHILIVYLGLPNVWFGEHIGSGYTSKPEVVLKKENASKKASSPMKGRTAKQGITSKQAKEPQVEPKSYAQACHDAIRSYCDNYVQCEAQYPKTFGKNLPCILYRKTHGEYHRYVSDTGLFKQDWWGKYVNKFESEPYDWDRVVLHELRKIHPPQRSSTFLQEVIDRHTRTLATFYQTVGGANKYKLRSVCLACLSHPPECVLSCDHVLCRRCVQDFGRIQNGRDIYLDACPLGHDSTTGQLLPELGPIFTGLSALVLDGCKTSYAFFAVILIIVFQWWSPWDHRVRSP
jgi:hypothetical protein